MPKSLKKVVSNPLFLAGIISLVVIAVSVQQFLLGPKTFEPGGPEYTHYNNYKIFKEAFFHLSEGKDLYQVYPAEYWDYYKYSPAFALFMAPMACLPDIVGLTIWNLLNALVLFFALWKVGVLSSRVRLLMLALVLIEMMTSVQNAQSNGLIAGLIILAFNKMEKGQLLLASLFIVITIYIKLFGLVALVLFIFYPKKLKSFLYSLGWGVIFAFIPLIIISWSQLMAQYQSWFILLQNDHSNSVGLSVAGWLYTWFGNEQKNLLLPIGMLLLLLPLIRYRSFKNLGYRMLFLSSILVWIVIFNHKAESPTFVIAVSGVAIWFFCQRFKIENLVLLILVVLFTILSPTDAFPASFREEFVIPYVLKAVPCILVWLKITIDLILFRPGKY